MNNMLKSIIGIVISLGILYCFYWILKTGSYLIFYEGMVKDTIIEMVQQGALK